MIIDSSKLVSILGYGVEGQSAARYFEDLGARVKVYDQNADKISQIPKKYHPQILNNFEQIDGDIAFRSPSLNPGLIKSTIPLSSSTQYFFEHCNKKIIGVSGTKGKGTTSSLIARILEQAGYHVWLIGNIGQPALDVLDEINNYPSDQQSAVVYEMSSFQLWDLKRSPNVAVLLRIIPEHLDIHDGLDDYSAAKANITRYQSDQDLLVYCPDNQFTQDIADLSKARKKRYYVAGEGAYIFDEIAKEPLKIGQLKKIRDGLSIMIGSQKIVDVSEVKLLGAHNLENICAAVTAVVDLTVTLEPIRKALMSFTGLQFRIQTLGVNNGVSYINDSYATAPGATLAAIRSMDNPFVLLFGGLDRGSDLTELISELKNTPQVIKIICYGEGGKRLATSDHELPTEYTNSTDFGHILDLARELAEERAPANLLLSPGCASFDMFENFTDRGQKFTQYFESLGKSV